MHGNSLVNVVHGGQEEKRAVLSTLCTFGLTTEQSCQRCPSHGRKRYTLVGTPLRYTLVGITLLLSHPEVHPGGYYSLLTPRGTPWWVLIPPYTQRYTLVGINPSFTPRGTPWWYIPLTHPEVHPGGIYLPAHPEVHPGGYIPPSHPEVHPGGYSPLSTPRGTPWWVFSSFYTRRYTLVGIFSFSTPRGTLVGMYTVICLPEG